MTLSDAPHPVRKALEMFWRMLVVGLVLAGSTAGSAEATDAGFDPSRFQVKYGVNGQGSPGYRVIDRDVFHLNNSQTPFLLPCDADRFEFGITADSAAGSDPVYWNVTVKFFELKPSNLEHQIVSHGCLGSTTFDSASAGVGLLMPGDQVDAAFTPIDSTGSFCAFQFQPTDLKLHVPVRMQVEMGLFSDPGFTTPAADVNPGNNVFSFWVMRANSGSCP